MQREFFPYRFLRQQKANALQKVWCFRMQNVLLEYGAACTQQPSALEGVRLLLR